MKGIDGEMENLGRGQVHKCYFGCAEFEMLLRHLNADMK